MKVESFGQKICALQSGEGRGYLYVICVVKKHKQRQDSLSYLLIERIFMVRNAGINIPIRSALKWRLLPYMASDSLRVERFFKSCP